MHISRVVQGHAGTHMSIDIAVCVVFVVYYRSNDTIAIVGPICQLYLVIGAHASNQAGRATAYALGGAVSVKEICVLEH